MTTKGLRERWGLTGSQLSKKFDVPIRTIQNWDYRDSAPDYVIYMMEMVLELEQKNGVLSKDLERFKTAFFNMRFIVENS